MQSGTHSFSSSGFSHHWLLCLGMLLLATTAQADNRTQVRRYLPFRETVIANEATSETASEALRSRQRVQVDAPDRRMTLSLTDNTELGIRSAYVQLQRGELESHPGSWVRLTRTPQGTQGLIFDGHELYVVAPQTTVVAGAGDDTVIYKLADAAATLPADWCGNSTTTAQTGMQMYEALATELDNQAAALPYNPDASLRLELQLVADSAFLAGYTGQDEALNALLVRINNVDGIFSNELGLRVQSADVQIMTQDHPSLSTTTDAGALLGSLAEWRNHSPVMGSYPLTHLVTGRNLDGDTMGIAYIGQICGSKYGVSLSESRDHNTWIDSLVLAHELAHQLGAVHDGTDQCASTPDNGYLMSAWVNGNSEFSACSKNMIQRKMTQAACLVPTSLPATSSNTPNQSPPTQAASGGGAWQFSWLAGLMLLLALRRQTAFDR